ncbi:MAG: manganese-dependent inorganic pyrophosphatase, partial [Spirochaetes bacterium]|nr:manganese-dependent inorganic pyrophosphatase [Spirochaetota bacterium]
MNKKTEELIYVVGHKAPDTDTICSAIAYADYLKKKNNNVVACRTGELNPETKYVLNYFKVEEPQFLSSAKGKKIILVDHNETKQSPEDIEEGEIVQIIDHHKVNFSYDKVISFYVEPIGATATIIAKQFIQDPTVKLPKEIAGLLLSAILSDTVIFRSPTTTREDVLIAQTLAEIAKIKNLEEFGINMKKEKSNLKGLTAQEIILSDFKEFDINNKKLGAGQIEVCDLKETQERKEELLKTIEQIAKKRDYDLLVFLAT